MTIPKGLADVEAARAAPLVTRRLESFDDGYQRNGAGLMMVVVQIEEGRRAA